MPPSKLIPSAVVSWIRTSLILRLVNGPVIQMPALTCWIHTSLMVESCSAAADAVDVGGVDPLGDLAEDGEVRQVDVGAWVGRQVAVDADVIARSTEYHSPAPVSVTLLTIRCAVTVKLPGGM